MSRVGKLPITLPSGVTMTANDSEITIAGSKGSLTQFTMPDITVKQEGEQIIVSRANDEPKTRAKHGLMRALLNNMVNGVTQGFSKKLEINGVGYKMPAGVTSKIEQNTITVSGISRQQVGQVAAEIRSLKKPEPYKGKGIKYEGERIVRKSGKSGKDK